MGYDKVFSARIAQTVFELSDETSSQQETISGERYMMNGVFPQNYEQWYHCITVECGISLTPDFINERIVSLQDENTFKTKQFIQLYGPQFHQQVLAWFHQAQGSMKGG